MSEIFEFLPESQFIIKALLVITSLWLLHLWQQNTRIFKLGNKIPGPKTLPFVGNALTALWVKPEDFVEVGLKIAEEHGHVARGWFGSRLLVFLSDADDVEVILNSHEHIDKSDEYKFFEPWLGDGLLISSGEKWRSHRKMLAPTFHINILKTFMPVFNKNSMIVVDKMRTEINKTFDVHEYMSGVTVDILLETVMGITRETHEQSGLEYATAVMKMCDIIHRRQYKVWLRLDAIFKLTSFYREQINLLNIIHRLTNKVIKNKKEIYLENKSKGLIPASIEELTGSKESNSSEVRKEKNTLADSVFKGFRDDLDLNDENDVGEKKRLAFLDLLVESAESGANKITNNEIKEEVDTFMFEGHDTTAAGSSFILCLLGNHQDIQSKVFAELFDIFGYSNRPVTFSDTVNMKYLERVILEGLRMYPPVPIIARKLNRDVEIVTNNYVLPAGSTAFIPTLRLHRNPKYFKNPHNFDPDNFLPENTQNRHYYAYIPFSAGPRSCVGRKYALLKMKVLLANILREFKIISDIPEDQFKLKADIILKRGDGFRVKIEPRYGRNCA